MMMPVRRAFLNACCAFPAACGGGHARVCFGSDDFCDGVFGRNRSPVADAGADRDVAAGSTVQLDGAASFDRDGAITTFSWTQQAGPAVTLNGADEAVADFTAPQVAAATVLAFRLVVTDDDGASDVDRVRITVLPDPTTVALAAGVAVLDGNPPPTEADGRSTDPVDLSLWLAARLLAADALAARAGPADEARVTVLLDRLRVMETVQIRQAPIDAMAPPERRLFESSQAAVAAFTRDRDPAVAELAARLSGDAALGTPAWHDLVATACPQLGWQRVSQQETTRWATTLLSDEPARAPPDAVAAAVLNLALAALEAPEHFGNRDAAGTLPGTPADPRN